jgi:hypothetical protein
VAGQKTLRVDVSRDLLTWARERSGIGRDALVRRFPKLPEWEGGRSLPTLNQLEDFAQATSESKRCSQECHGNSPEEHQPISFTFHTTLSSPGRQCGFSRHFRFLPKRISPLDTAITAPAAIRVIHHGNRTNSAISASSPILAKRHLGRGPTDEVSAW